jgi:hypothetical protein
LTNIVITSTPVLPGQEPLVSTNGAGQLTLMSSGTNGTATNAVPGPGFANDYVQITATYPVSTITPLVSAYFPCRVSTIVKNEPALLNFEHTNMYGTSPTDP